MKNISFFFFISVFALQAFSIGVDDRNEHGETALIRAASDGNLQESKKLLKAGASINIKDNEGNTALFFAVGENSLPVTQLLVKSRADLKMVFGEKKETILFEAARTGNVAIAELLIRADRSLVDSVNTDQETPLFEAVRNDSAKMTLALIKAGVAKDKVNTAGETALSLAEKNKNQAIIKVLKSK